MISDESLYTQVRAGKRDALAALVDRYHASLLRYLERMTGSTLLAEDLTQEIFIRILTFQGKEPAKFRAWVFTIAGNLARDTFRSADYRRMENPDPEKAEWLEIPAQSPLVEEMVLAGRSRETVAGLLQQLPAAQREVLILRFYEEMKLDEIADICQVPLGTVKSRLFHALRTLKEILQNEEVLV